MKIISIVMQLINLLKKHSSKPWHQIAITVLRTNPEFCCYNSVGSVKSNFLCIRELRNKRSGSDWRDYNETHQFKVVSLNNGLFISKK